MIIYIYFFDIYNTFFLKYIYFFDIYNTFFLKYIKKKVLYTSKYSLDICKYIILL